MPFDPSLAQNVTSYLDGKDFLRSVLKITTQYLFERPRLITDPTPKRTGRTDSPDLFFEFSTHEHIVRICVDSWNRSGQICWIIGCSYADGTDPLICRVIQHSSDLLWLEYQDEFIQIYSKLRVLLQPTSSSPNVAEKISRMFF